MKTAEKLVRLLRKKQLTFTAAESCTGGMVCEAVTAVPGSSNVFQRGYVTYCDQAKHEMLGVKKETLAAWTAVSRQTAAEMARGAARAARAQAAVSVTGYAGPPSGGEGEQVGLVYVGCFYRGKTRVCKCLFSGNRAAVRKKACRKALQMACDMIQ